MVLEITITYFRIKETLIRNMELVLVKSRKQRPSYFGRNIEMTVDLKCIDDTWKNSLKGIANTVPL